ncbi:MAG: hypothetical protein H0V19_00400 [Euzebyales bacterium]|nr:hypothetical protein [Euzebyales bacterium]
MDTTVLRAGLSEAWTSVALFTPRIVAALLILLVGWLVATLLRRACGRVLAAVRFERALHAAGVHTAAEQSAYDAQGIVAGVVYWLVLLVTFRLAADTLGATALSTALAGLIAYLPQVLVAVAIVLVALAFANFVAGAIRANAGSRGDLGARIAFWSIAGFGAFAALNQLQVAEPIVTALFYATLATLGLTVVVAFGVGGVPAAREMTGRWLRRGDPSGDATMGRAA